MRSKSNKKVLSSKNNHGGKESDYVHVSESFITGKLKIKEHKKLTDGLDGGANNVHYESEDSEVKALGKQASKPSKASKIDNSPGKKGKKRTKASPGAHGSRNEA